MREELKHELRTILDYYYTGSALSDTIILNAMETAYRHGYLDAMQEMSRNSDHDIDVTIKTTPSQEPCDKVSHDCHIEYDTLSHESCEIMFTEWICTSCKYFEWDMDDKCICHYHNREAVYADYDCEDFTER
jgi:hypothetical protein